MAGRQPTRAKATPARPRAARPTPVAGTVAAPNEPRRPQQERGQRRVEAILDATSAIVAEEGAPAVTMHAIARRSGTTIGSLYHFFPDRDAVFAALLERHATRFGERLAPLESVDWSTLSVERSVERFLAAALGYIGDNPDLLPVAHVLHAEHPKRPRHEGPEQMLQRVVAAIVAAHAPRAAASARAAHAAMILAAVEGAVERGHRIPQPGPVVMQRELKRMLCTYIESLG
jgi:AcrR family transcriptional regulator